MVEEDREIRTDFSEETVLVDRAAVVGLEHRTPTTAVPEATEEMVTSVWCAYEHGTKSSRF